MTKHGLLFLGALIAATSLVAGAGCGDDGKSGSGGTGGTGATGGMGGTGGTGGAGGAGGAGGGNALSCEAYCGAITANCAGANMQYADMPSCMGACEAFDEGTAMDTMGNTLGCRIYHAGAAKMAPEMHCSHAGPAGDGQCGTICDGYCAIVMDACSTAYADDAACMTACTGFTSAGPGKYNAMSHATGDTTECRLYHATVAATDDATATTHCPHVLENSSECK
ncbi:hypothetical protein [Polyangium aurulentum]|uniref:hypothetical protein n=1 Tax=Polyangium aurulentum TaxID=2567896 RepID=UPI00197DDB9E|nr:hypothetical protein [Polyangium aurulentum]UQA59358.1 hypothetical protein E8A73_002270 [Polyangium aurulentum]